MSVMTSGKAPSVSFEGALIPPKNKGDQGTKNYNSKEVLLKTSKTVS
jgi:hypothetical protein